MTGSSRGAVRRTTPTPCVRRSAPLGPEVTDRRCGWTFGVSGRGDRAEVRVAERTLRVARPGLGPVGPRLELVHHRGMLVDTDHDEIPGVGARHRVPYGFDLVEDDLELLAAAALRHRLAYPFGDQCRGVTSPAAAERQVLADHDHVEVLRGHGP